MNRLLRSQRKMSVFCNLCGTIFNYSFQLKIHHRTHTGEKPFQCQLCEKAFSHEAHLIVHKQIHIQKKQYVHEISNNSIIQKSSIEKSVDLYKDELKNGAKIQKEHNAGEFCNNSLIQKSAQENHADIFEDECKKERIQKELYIREFSNNSLTQKSAIGKPADLGKDESKDKPCVKNDLPNEKVLNRPRITLKLKKYDTWVICNEVKDTLEDDFSNENSLDRQNVNIGQREQYPCVICTKVFSKESDLILHSQIHAQKEEYVCELCNATFLQKATLKEHTQIHKNERNDKKLRERDLNLENVALKQDKLHTYAFCSDESSKECGVIRNFPADKDKKLHSSDKKYRKKLSKKSKLTIHSLHTKQEPFACDAYGKVISHKRNTKTRERVKRNVTVFVCETCGNSFSDKHNWNIHHCVHVKRYKCKVCGKSFGQVTTLNVHYRTHTN